MQNKNSLKDTILVYENSIKEITSQEDAFILLVDIKRNSLYLPTLDIYIPIKSHFEGIIIECYDTKVTRIINNARRSSVYRQKIDNFIDAKIKDLLVMPISNNSEKNSIIAIIWVATAYKSLDKFTKKDIKRLEGLSVDIRDTIISQKSEQLEKVNSINLDDNTLNNLNILIIDNSPIVVRFIEFVLKDYYTNIISVSDATSAIEKFKYKKIDIIFVDEMILGMSESKTIETIRQVEIENGFDSIPIFAITGSTDKKTTDNLLNSGANIVLYNPMVAQDIIKAIEQFRVLTNKGIEALVQTI